MNAKPKLLRVVPYKDPILRQVMKPLKFPLTPGERRLIASMRFSIQPEQLAKAGAPWDAAVGMAANQWGAAKRIFLYCPDADTESLQVIINPTYEPIANPDTGAFEDEEAWEGCFSVPLCTGLVRRPRHIRVTFQNEKGESFEGELHDWDARVWQHETDHLDGRLYEKPGCGECKDFRRFATRDEVDAFHQSINEKADDNA